MEHGARVGPKGQIVIPKRLRDEFGISPGDEVIIREELGGILVKKPSVDAVGILRDIARRGTSVKIDTHAYETQLKDRWKAAR